MYFLPILAAILAYLAFPSLLLAAVVALLVRGYFIFAGNGVSKYLKNGINGQIAYRILSSKLLSLNGEMSEEAYHCHHLLTPDLPENSELRGDLRNAAYTGGDDWKHWARVIRRIYGGDPIQILDRYESLVIQLKASPQDITVDSQDRLIEIGKMWGVGPTKAREYLAEMKVPPSPRMIAW